MRTGDFESTFHARVVSSLADSCSTRKPTVGDGDSNSLGWSCQMTALKSQPWLGDYNGHRSFAKETAEEVFFAVAPVICAHRVFAPRRTGQRPVRKELGRFRLKCAHTDDGTRTDEKSKTV